MSKKIILLDDKSREEFYKVNLLELKNVVSISGEEKCHAKLESFMKNNDSFSEYDYIIIHKSMYKDNKNYQKNLFKKLEEEYHNKLIYFTGDSSSILSSKIMYKNLHIFSNKVEKEEEDVLMLQYGQNWEVDILLNVLEQINLFIENGDNYKENVKLLELEKIGINDNLSLDDPTNIRKVILENIERKLND